MASPVLTIRVNWPRLESLEDTALGISGLVSAWPLKEAAGSATCLDRVGGNQATVNGVTLGATALIYEDEATAASFDGTNDYLSIADATNLDTTDTFSFWATIARTAVGTKLYIAHKGTGAWGLYVSAANALTLEEVGTADIVASSTTLDTATHDVCVTKSGATVKLYIDGLDVTGTVTNQTLANTATALEIGRSQAAGNYFAGTMQWPLLFNVALTPAQVASLHVARKYGEFGLSMFSIRHMVEGISRSRGVNADYSGDQIGELTLDCDDQNGYFLPDRNLALNPSLEWGLEDWSAVSNGVLSWRNDAPSGGGSYCGRATGAGTGDGAQTTISESVPSGGTVSATIALKSISGTTSARLTVRDGTTIENLDVTITTSWARYGPVTLTTTGARTSATFEVKSQGAAATFDFDALQINLGSTANDYTEGPSKPWLAGGAPIHVRASYEGTDYPLFYGHIERLDPRPEEFRCGIVAYDPLKLLELPVDVALVKSTMYRGRYAVLDRAIQRRDLGEDNLLIGQSSALGWTFAGGATGGGTIDVPTAGDATYNDTGGRVYFPTMRVGRLYTFAFDAKAASGTPTLTSVVGARGATVSATTGNGGYPALTTSYQRYEITYECTAEAAPYIDFDSTGAEVNIRRIVISEGLVPASDTTLSFGSPTGRLTNWSIEPNQQAVEAVTPWEHGWYNWCTNPEAVTNTTGWSTAVSWPVTDAGATITRVTAGSYYPGTADGTPDFSTAFRVDSTAGGDLGEGAGFTMTGTAISGRTYYLSVNVDGTGGSGTWQFAVGVSGDSNGSSTFDASVDQSFTVAWTPTANRASPVVGVIKTAGAGASRVTFTAVMFTNGSRAYARTGFSSPATLIEASTITSAADGVSHVKCVEVATTAVAGSGVALTSGLYQVSGVVYTFSCWLKSTSGTPTVTVGIGDPYGPDSTPEVATITATLSTTWRRFVVQFTGTDTLLRPSGSNITAFVTTDTAAAVTFRIDDYSLTLGTRTQDYLVPQAAGLDTADVDIVPSTSYAVTDATTILAQLNQYTLAHHWIAPRLKRPWWYYTTQARQSLAGLAVDETLSSLVGDGIQSFRGLERDRQSIKHMVIVEYNGASTVVPGTGATSAQTVTISAVDTTSLRRHGFVPGDNQAIHTVEGAGLLNGPATGDTTAQNIANLLLTRFKVPRIRPEMTIQNHWPAQLQRPEMTIQNHWPAQLQRQPGDLLAITYTRAGIAGVRYILLSETLEIRDSGTLWESAYQLEEFVAS